MLMRPALPLGLRSPERSRRGPLRHLRISVVAVALVAAACSAAPGPDPTGSPCTSPRVVDQSREALVADCEALWAIHSSEGLDDVVGLEGTANDPTFEQIYAWGDPNPLDDWYGVSVTDGRVTGLTLHGISPDTWPDLLALTELRHLTVYCVSGPIPPELADLRNLETLGLVSGVIGADGSSSGMSADGLYECPGTMAGPIPPELGNLTNLTDLTLGNGELSGPIPPEIGNLTNLFVLSLGGRLSGSIPPELGNLTNLYHLILTNNQLSGPIPPELGNLSRLGILNLAVNRLSGPIPAELGNLKSLRELSLGYNFLSGPIPAELGELVALYLLNLNCNNLSGPMPQQLTSLRGLQSLYLHHNQLSGLIPPGLGDLPHLIGLYISGNQLSGPIPPELARASKLGTLDLSGNQLSGQIPAELSGLTDLAILDLKDNRLSGPVPEGLADLANLWLLSLEGNELTEPRPKGLEERPDWWDGTVGDHTSRITWDQWNAYCLRDSEPDQGTGQPTTTSPSTDDQAETSIAPQDTELEQPVDGNDQTGPGKSAVSEETLDSVERVSRIGWLLPWGELLPQGKLLPWGEGFLEVGHPVMDEDRADRTRLVSRISADGIDWSPIERLPIRMPDPQIVGLPSVWPYRRGGSSVITASDGERLVLGMLAGNTGEDTVVAITSDLTRWEIFEIPVPSSEGLPDGVTAEPSVIDLAIGPEGWLLLREVQLGVDPWVIAPADIRETARYIELGDPDYVGGEHIQGESQGLEIEWETDQHGPNDPYFSRFVTWEELGIDEDTYREYGRIHFGNKPYSPSWLASGEVWAAEWGNSPVRSALPDMSGGFWSGVVGTDAGYLARSRWGEAGYPQVVGPDYFSADGSNWVRRDTPILNGLPYFGGMSIVMDGVVLNGRLLDLDSGTESESQLWLGDATGTNWRPIELPGLAEGSWYDLRYSRGGAVVKGGASEDDSSVEWMMMSRDGVDWLVVEEPSVANLGGFVLNGNVMLALDGKGDTHRFLLP